MSEFMSDSMRANGVSATDSALDLLRSRQWAGPDTNSSFERFLMSQTQTKARRRVSSRLIIGFTIVGLALSAAAAGVYNQWVTLRLTSGEEKLMQAIDNGDQTLTLIDQDGGEQTAHVCAVGPLGSAVGLVLRDR